MYQGEEQTSERLMTVGELARRTGMSAKAIRLEPSTPSVPSHGTAKDLACFCAFCGPAICH
jgi:hypothetical protein